MIKFKEFFFTFDNSVLTNMEKDFSYFNDRLLKEIASFEKNNPGFFFKCYRDIYIRGMNKNRHCTTIYFEDDLTNVFKSHRNSITLMDSYFQVGRIDIPIFLGYYKNLKDGFIDSHPSFTYTGGTVSKVDKYLWNSSIEQTCVTEYSVSLNFIKNCIDNASMGKCSSYIFVDDFRKETNSND